MKYQQAFEHEARRGRKALRQSAPFLTGYVKRNGCHCAVCDRKIKEIAGYQLVFGGKPAPGYCGFAAVAICGRCRHKSARRINKTVDKNIEKRLARYALPLVVDGMFQWFTLDSDDRKWFDSHPERNYRLRPSSKKERLIASAPPKVEMVTIVGRGISDKQTQIAVQPVAYGQQIEDCDEVLEKLLRVIVKNEPSA